MADFCTSSKPDRPVPEGQSGGSQLVFGRLHGGRHTSHHRGHVDDRYSWSANHGATTLIFDWCSLVYKLFFQEFPVYLNLPLEGCVRFAFLCGAAAFLSIFPHPFFSHLNCSWFWVPGWAWLVHWCASAELWLEKRPQFGTLLSCWVRPSVPWVSPSSFSPPPSLQPSGSLITNVQQRTWSPQCVSFYIFDTDWLTLPWNHYKLALMLHPFLTVTLNPKHAVMPRSASRGLY